MMWQIVLSLVCVAFLGAILWEKRQGKLMQSASDRKLENVNCLFDAILTHIHAYVLVIDSDFKVLKTNYYDLTHLSPDGKEKRVGDLLQCRNALSAKGGCGTHAFCQECPVRGAIGNAFRQKKEFTDLQSSLNIAIDEHEFVKCDVMISGVFMTLDSEERMVLTVHDITSIKQTEEALAEAKEKAENADRSKSAFLANMSHEIRTPLNAIVGFTNVLLGEGSEEIDPDEKASMLEIINHNNELLLKLINDVLEISRLDSGSLDFDMKEWNMTDIVKEIYKTYQPLIRPSLQFRLELDDTVPVPVHTDRLRFAQVISNFLNNANKFTQNGYIALGCKVDKKHREVRIYVEDSGKGIDEKELMMIFERFYKTDEFEQGSGLGLAISKVIIERLSGRIKVHSEKGKGSCFAVILSLADAPENHMLI